jgi:hypothetical protein
LIKNIVIPLETEYLEEAAKARGISRTMLARIVMERVIERRIVGEIIGTEAISIPKPVKYRRFKQRAA